MRNVLLALVFFFQAPAVPWSTLPALPEPVSNNAVASWIHKDRVMLFSLMGIGPRKTYDDIWPRAMVYDTRRSQWLTLPQVPGIVGRIAASAESVNGQVYLFGGYTVDAKGNEVSLSNVDIYTPGNPEPAQGYWSKGIPMSVAVDDAAAGVYDNRFVLLISGWSQQDNIDNVQIYDTVRDRWRKGTPIPGMPVFGHAGGISGKTIVYCGGAYKNPAWTRENGKPRYLASDECWQGNIKSRDGVKIEWKRLPAHPGHAQYRMAAGVWGKRIVFSGGTDNPYNYNGIGYNGVPSQPSATTFAWNTGTNSWETLPDNPLPTMDHRGMVADRDGLVIIGGMQADQQVTTRVAHLAVPK